jgi:hypothetical protein
MTMRSYLGSMLVCCGVLFAASCGGDPSPEETNCSDATDNDNDGLTDCSDDDCRSTCGPSTCGNGALDSGETCDGTLLNNKTCVTEGFDAGTLACAGNCTSFVTSGCSNLGDNTASCTGATAVAVPSTTNGNNTGGATNIGEISCFVPENASDSYGPATFYRINPTATGTLLLTLTSDEDLMLVAYEACGQADVACADQEIGGTDEMTTVETTSGSPIYVAIVGYTTTDAGAFTLTVEPLVESECGDLEDNDFDGDTDCADSDCAGPACTPGSGLLGDPCAANNACALINGSGPLCAREADTGMPGGLCTRFCEDNADCGSDGVCVGICVKKCTRSSDCRAGTDCVPGDEPSCGAMCTANAQCESGFCSEGDGSCYEADEVCTGGQDEDQDGAADCEDTDCTVGCQPGGLTETELNNALGQADTYTAGFTGALSPPLADIDFVKFTVGGAGAVTIVSSGTDCATGMMATTLIVFGPDLTEVATGMDTSTTNLCDTATFNATASGTYYLVIYGDDETVKQYTLAITAP